MRRFAAPHVSMRALRSRQLQGKATRPPTGEGVRLLSRPGQKSDPTIADATDPSDPAREG